MGNEPAAVPVAPPADELAPGQVIELEIGAIAHGGHCVARYEGRVVFVRLALPGERALVRLTEVRSGSFCRGEAIEILTAHPERVEAPCAHFAPGACGGCDLQHAAGDLQRRLKAEVVREQLRRLAGLDLDVTVESLPGNGFGWRTRVRWALDDAGRIGPRAVRSHRVVGISPAQPCLIAADGLSELAGVADPPAGLRRPNGRLRSAGSSGRPKAGAPPRRGRSADLPEVVLVHAGDGSNQAIWSGQIADPVVEHVVGRDFSVAGDGFWQAHSAAADTLAQAVTESLHSLAAGGSAWDLYGGVGLFSAVLAARVGPEGSVVNVEGDRTAVELATANLADLPWVRAIGGSVEQTLAELPAQVDAVVLDPPRTGAGPALCVEIAKRRPAEIVYVACDPAALGRDAAALSEAGYRLDTLRAFDCFPQTHHVECVARFVPTEPTGS